MRFRLVIIALVLGAGLTYLATRGLPGGDEPAGEAAAIANPNVNRFDARRALADVRGLLAFGPRPAGSAASRRAARYLHARLPGARYERVPGGLRNVVGWLPGRRPAVVIGAHYDTEASPPGFVGANDGAAGPAAVLEIARALRRSRPRGGPELRFVLFDGEEEPPGSDDFLSDGLRGSRAYVRAHRREVGSMILLDYVANRGLRLPREGSSDRRLWARLRAAARRVGVLSTFPNRTQTAVYDDHTPFLDAGIPAIDLIDFSYAHRDRVTDTYDKLSERSLDAVGEAVVELVRGL